MSACVPRFVHPLKKRHAGKVDVNTERFFHRPIEWAGGDQFLIAYRLSPSRRDDCTRRPSFLISCPLTNPRTLCACQPVAAMIAVSVAPASFYRLYKKKVSGKNGCWISAWAWSRCAIAWRRSRRPTMSFKVRALIARDHVPRRSGAGSGQCPVTIP